MAHAGGLLAALRAAVLSIIPCWRPPDSPPHCLVFNIMAPPEMPPVPAQGEAADGLAVHGALAAGFQRAMDLGRRAA